MLEWRMLFDNDSWIIDLQPMNPRKWQNDAELQPPFGSLAAQGSIGPLLTPRPIPPGWFVVSGILACFIAGCRAIGRAEINNRLAATDDISNAIESTDCQATDQTASTTGDCDATYLPRQRCHHLAQARIGLPGGRPLSTRHWRLRRPRRLPDGTASPGGNRIRSRPLAGIFSSTGGFTVPLCLQLHRCHQHGVAWILAAALPCRYDRDRTQLGVAPSANPFGAAVHSCQLRGLR